MKKAFRFMGIIAIGAVFGFLMVTCDNGNGDPCKNGHDYSELQSTTATCTNPGVSIFKCSRCTSTNEQSAVALGHSNPINWTSGTAATCTTASTRIKTCTRVGCDVTVETETQDALGHDHTSSLVCKRIGCDHQYALGDTGPGGGKIFYISSTGFTVQMVDPAQNYTAYYLEAAPANTVGGTGSQTTMRWSTATSGYPTITDLVNIFSDDIGYGPTVPTATQIDNLNSDIGMGRKNTALIVQYDPCTDYIHAAQACTNYSNNDKTDWFLPSIGELYWLYQNRTATDMPTSGWYWSSSQLGSNIAWIMYFTEGYSLSSGTKNDDLLVRPVRVF